MKMILYLVVIFFSIGVTVRGANVSYGLSTIIEKCSKHGDTDEFFNCATIKTLREMESIVGQKKIEILPGIELISISPASKNAEIEDEDTLNLGKRNDSLLEVLTDETARLFSGKEIRINLSKSSTQSISKAIEEGRGKMKKLNPIILVLGALATLIVWLMIGGVSLISAKALVIGKVALVLSLILLLNGFSIGGTNMLPSFKHGIPSPTNYGVNYPNYYPYGTNSLGGWNTHDKYPFARSFSHKRVADK